MGKTWGRFPFFRIQGYENLTPELTGRKELREAFKFTMTSNVTPLRLNELFGVVQLSLELGSGELISSSAISTFNFTSFSTPTPNARINRRESNHSTLTASIHDESHSIRAFG